jgi:hypothetical protein
MTIMSCSSPNSSTASEAHSAAVASSVISPVFSQPTTVTHTDFENFPNALKKKLSSLTLKSQPLVTLFPLPSPGPQVVTAEKLKEMRIKHLKQIYSETAPPEKKEKTEDSQKPK